MSPAASASVQPFFLSTSESRPLTYQRMRRRDSTRGNRPANRPRNASKPTDQLATNSIDTEINYQISIFDDNLSLSY